MYVHTSGNDRGQGSSEAWHFNNVVTGVSMRPGDTQIRDVHCGGNTHWVITLIDLTGNKIDIRFIPVHIEIASLFFFSSLICFWLVLN